MAFRIAFTNSRAGADYEYEREALDAIGAEVVPLEVPDQASYAALLADFDAVVPGPGARLTADVIAQLTRCKVIATNGIGVDSIDLEAATTAGIPICNVPDLFIEEVADHAFTLLLAVNRRLLFCHEMATTDRWQEGFRTLGSVPKIWGKTLGLVAFGNIARAVARRGLAFGLRVIAHDPFVTPEQMIEHGVAAKTLAEVMRESDFVSAHAPHTASTHHLLSDAQFGAMKPTAVFINTGRGKTVDEPALIRALQAGRIAGAGLDVFEQEPPDPANPLLHLPNVVVTPHMASYSNEANIERRRRHGQELAAVLTGKRPRNCVNRAVLERLSLV